MYTRARPTEYGRLVYLRLFEALFDLRHERVYTTGNASLSERGQTEFDPICAPASIESRPGARLVPAANDLLPLNERVGCRQTWATRSKLGLRRRWQSGESQGEVS